MSYALELANAREEARATGSRLHGLKLRGDVRARVALGCFGIAQQHHSSILILLSHANPLPASALAMLRPLLEATLRGFWVAKCASDEQVGNMLSGEKKQLDMASVIKALLHVLSPEGEHAEFHSRVWPVLSAYTHTYEQQLHPWIDGSDIDPQYTEQQLTWLVSRASLAMALTEAGIRTFLSSEQADAV